MLAELCAKEGFTDSVLISVNTPLCSEEQTNSTESWVYQQLTRSLGQVPLFSELQFSSL